MPPKGGRLDTEPHLWVNRAASPHSYSSVTSFALEIDLDIIAAFVINITFEMLCAASVCS